MVPTRWRTGGPITVANDITPQQIDAIVDDRAVGAILELTQRPLEVEDQSDENAS